MSQMPDEDRELDAFLARESPLQRQWRDLPHEEPGADLDASVRAAARRAVHAGPRAGGAAPVARWRFPLAIAATVVIGSSLTLMVARHEPPLQADRSAGVERPAPAEAAETSSAAASDVAPAEAARDPGVAAALKQAMPTAGRGPNADAQTAPNGHANTEAKRARPARAREQPEPAPSAEHVEAKLAPARPSADGARLSEQTIADALAPPNEAAPAVPSPAQPPAAPAAPAAVASASQNPRAAKMNSRAYSAPEPPSPDAVRADSADALAPAAWIERIRALRRAGKPEEAQRELRALLARHPGYELPEDLKPARGPTGPATAPGRE